MHGRYINREVLRAHGLAIVNLEDDQAQQDFILSIFHAATHTFTQSGTAKIIENHRGSAFIEQIQKVQQVVLERPLGSPSPAQPQQPQHIEPPFPRKKRWP
jgi:hypothetical protein